MHYHPYLDPKTLEKIGAWEDESGSVVGVVHHEFYLDEVYFEVHPDYTWLKPMMLEYAEEHLYRTAENGERHVRAYINDFDGMFESAAEARGYVKMERRRESVSWFKIPRPFPAIHVPDGFRIVSILASAPNGDYASYCGMWYDAIDRMAYVEPVATDPDYRRMGLGTAVVLEGIWRCGELDATVAYVGTDKPFYLNMGFKKAFTINAWAKMIW